MKRKYGTQKLEEFKGKENIKNSMLNNPTALHCQDFVSKRSGGARA